MAIGDDFSVNNAGDIRHTSGSSTYTVLELHRWLQGLADNASSTGDDLIDMTSNTPSDRSTDNIITLLGTYNIDDTAAQFLYDGSIIQSSGATIYDGIVNFGSAGIHLEIMQNGALITPNFWTTGLNADSSAGISHRFLVKTRTGGADIDGRRLLGMAREFGYTYSEFSINGTARGNNVLAVTHSLDLNNATAAATVATWNTITNTEGYRSIDVNADTVVERYYSEWNRAAFTINQFYERLKWLSRRGTASTLYGLNGGIFRGITHEIVIDTPTGTFNAVEPVTWTGGTGQMLAINSPTAGTIMWIQLLTGVAPTDNQVITGSTSLATATVNVTVTERSISLPFVGASTGSAIIGSYGLGLEAADLTAADKVFDLTNTQISPPNYVTFTVFGLATGEDRVLVGPESGGNILTTQLSVSGSLSGGSATVLVQEAIPADTPAAGTIRIYDGDSFARVTYTSWSGSTFSGCTGVPAASDGDDVWISYIDTLASGSSASFTSIYSSNRSLFVRVRDGGGSPIKTFETTATLGSSGGSSTAIRTSDS